MGPWHLLGPFSERWDFNGCFFPQSYCNKMGVTPVIIIFFGFSSTIQLRGYLQEVLRMGDDSLGFLTRHFRVTFLVIEW